MSRKLSCLVVFAIFTGNLAYSQYVEDTLTVNRADVSPYVDGYIAEDEWDTEEFDTITYWGRDEDENLHAPEDWDCVARYKMLWDDEYIFSWGH